MKKSFLLSVMLLSSVFMFCSDTGPGSGGGGAYPVGNGGAEAGGGADAGNVRSRAHVGRNPFYPSLSSQSGKRVLPAGLTNNIFSFLAPKDEQSLAQTNVDHDFAYRQKHRFDIALQKCQPLILRSHEGWVRSVAVLADGRIVSGDGPITPSGGTVRIWNATTEEQLQVLRGHEYAVNSITVLADDRIVSGGDDKAIRIWPSREYLEKKYEQSLSMTESEGRALFALDGEGVYEALFPQPRKRVGEVSEAVADSTHQVAQEQPISAAEAAMRLEDAAAKAARENQDSEDRSGEDAKIEKNQNDVINALNQIDAFTEMKPLLKQILEQFFELRGNAGGWRLLGGAKESYFLQRKYFVDDRLIQQVIDALQRWQEHNRYFRRKISALGIQKDVPGWIALLEKSLAVDEILARMNGEFGGGQSSEAGGGSK